jgi:hypothetical protein
MKISKLKYVLALPLIYISSGLMAQDQTAEQRRNAKVDSLMIVERNAENLSQMEANRTTAEATAKEAQRVERNATEAARESKEAYRTEKKAQKARGKADKQAKKAAKARAKSDNN